MIGYILLAGVLVLFGSVAIAKLVKDSADGKAACKEEESNDGDT